MFPFAFKNKSIVGLDLGTTSIKGAELRRSGAKWQLHRIGSLPVSPKAMSNGKIKDKDAVVQVLRDLWSSSRFDSKQVALSVGGPSVIIKKIQVAQMSEMDLEDVIRTESEEHIPFDIAEVYLDFQILGQTEKGMDVLLTACKKELVDIRLEVIREAGLDPVLCDVDLFSVANSFAAFCLPAQDKPSGKKPPPKTPAPDATEKLDVTALVNIGAASLNLAIIANGMPEFTRDHSFGGERMVQEIMQQQETSGEEAELMLRSGTDSRNRPWPAESRELIILPFLEQAGNLIKQSMDFYHASHANHRVAALYLSGGCAMLPEINSKLNSILNIQVKTANPLAALLGKSTPPIQPETAPCYMVALGLATRGEERNHP
ncbi:MAG: pilus assembly protein PilM [Magnetococcus sp. YQC-5]